MMTNRLDMRGGGIKKNLKKKLLELDMYGLMSGGATRYFFFVFLCVCVCFLIGNLLEAGQ